MSNIAEGLYPPKYTYSTLIEFEDYITPIEEENILLFMSQSDFTALLEDVENNYPSFTYFGLLASTDYFEYKDGEEVLRNSLFRNEAKLKLGDKTIIIEIV